MGTISIPLMAMREYAMIGQFVHCFMVSIRVKVVMILILSYLFTRYAQFNPYSTRTSYRNDLGYGKKKKNYPKLLPPNTCSTLLHLAMNVPFTAGTAQPHRPHIRLAPPSTPSFLPFHSTPVSLFLAERHSSHRDIWSPSLSTARAYYLGRDNCTSRIPKR